MTMIKGDRVVATKTTLLGHEAKEVLKNVKYPKATIKDISYGSFGILCLIKLDGYKHEQVLPPQALKKLEGKNDELPKKL